MLFFSRAGSLPATTIAILSLIGLSSPGKAWELDRTPVNMAAVATTSSALNIPEIVPASDSLIPNANDATPDEVNLATAPVPSAGLTYVSLAAAVAAQDVPGDVDSELGCLAGAVYFESKGEPLSGQLAVANVILNRTTSGRFPKSICGVVKQPGQFSFVRGGAIPAIRANPQYRTAIAIARIAMNDQWENPAPNALYFHARYVSPGWGRPRVAMIGNHIFYR